MIHDVFCTHRLERQLSFRIKYAKDHNFLDLGICLQGQQGPVVAATDYEKGYAAQIREHVEVPFIALGTNGFGRSDLRATLRDFFEVSPEHIAYAALCALVESGDFDAARLLDAQKQLGLHADAVNPME